MRTICRWSQSQTMAKGFLLASWQIIERQMIINIPHRMRHANHFLLFSVRFDCSTSFIWVGNGINMFIDQNLDYIYLACSCLSNASCTILVCTTVYKCIKLTWPRLGFYLSKLNTTAVQFSTTKIKRVNIIFNFNILKLILI